jgi:DNA-binding NarL/FixJ family response regulator
VTALPAETIRVLLCDQQPLFRDGVRQTLAVTPDVVLAAEAGSGRDALQQLEGADPAVCLIDADLPLGVPALGFGDPHAPGGIELARTIKHKHPEVGVMILTGFEEEEQLFQAIKVGAAAYTRRDVTPEALVDLIRRVSRGEYVISDSVLVRPQVTERMLKLFKELEQSQEAVDPLFVPLSTREVEILDFIAHGQSNRAIARLLNISDQTVKNHITSILRKLAVNDRTQAVIYALRNNWIKL